LTKNVFKRISANSSTNFNCNSNPNPDPNHKAQKLFWENKMMSFFGQVSRYVEMQSFLEMSA